MKTGMLSPKTTYAAFLILKIMEKFSGLESVPMKVSVRFVGKMKVGNGKEDCGSTVYLRFPSDRPVPEDHNGRVPQKRKDKWMEIELGEFFNDEGNDDGEVDIRLREVKDLGWKSGLLVKGIELRPEAV
ncbi:putative F-box protein PP2-B2 [Camellia lanceoleosa]|uniref:F-box protein PP2-B2 n=1 Tax=Camellia lanceoleosa TaxID=1840588 RepID=A0ACC0GVB7_9ERIC|nr:putative F-box protein PP2-B2 [Camellia lanceoleosa]